MTRQAEEYKISDTGETSKKGHEQYEKIGGGVQIRVRWRIVVDLEKNSKTLLMTTVIIIIATSLSPSSESGALVFFSPTDFTVLLCELLPAMIKHQNT